jgi:hypothetical protein
MLRAYVLPSVTFFCGQTILNWKAINGSNCRTIQTKFHLENKSAPRNYLNVDLKMCKLCNLKYHSCFSVIVSMRNLKKNAEPRNLALLNRP